MNNFSKKNVPSGTSNNFSIEDCLVSAQTIHANDGELDHVMRETVPIAPVKLGSVSSEHFAQAKLVLKNKPKLKKCLEVDPIPVQIPVPVPIQVLEPYLIASFDVGIKNLAYCIMSYQPERQKGAQFMIHEWQVIDILDEETKKHFCHKCHLPGNYYHIVNSQQVFYCLRHGKAVDPGLKSGLGPSLLTKHRRVDNTTNLELNVEMITALDRHPMLTKCQEIVIEQQPSKNAKMKNLSFMLFSYFATRGLVDAEERVLRNIRFINGKHKLNVYDGPEIVCHLKGQYHRNKFYGHAYCRYMIRNDPEHLEQLTKSKKKDDLSDCFLQGAWYLLQRG